MIHIALSDWLEFREENGYFSFVAAERFGPIEAPFRKVICVTQSLGKYIKENPQKTFGATTILPPQRFEITSGPERFGGFKICYSPIATKGALVFLEHAAKPEGRVHLMEGDTTAKILKKCGDSDKPNWKFRTQINRRIGIAAIMHEGQKVVFHLAGHKQEVHIYTWDGVNVQHEHLE